MKKILFIIFILYSHLLTAKDTQRIIVVGKQNHIKPEDTTYAITIITSDDIKKSGAVNITDVLNRTAGINFYKYGSAAALGKVSIRGSSNEQILVLINGERINTSTGGGLDFSTIKLNSIKRIEVIKEGMSAIYGDGAFAGIINIITKDNEQWKNNISSYYSYGSFNTHSFGINSNIKYKKYIRYFINIDSLISEGGYLFENQRQGTIQKRENTGITSGEINSKIIFNLKKTKIISGVRYYKDEKGVPGSIEFPSSSATMYDTFFTANFLYKYFFNSITATIGFSYQNMYRRFTDDKFFLGKIDDINNSYIYSGLTKINTKFYFLGSHNITINYDYRLEKLYSTALEKSDASTFAGDIEKISHSINFIDDILLIKNILLFKTAIRYDAFNIYDNKISYYAGCNIKSDKKRRFSLKAGWATSYRTPSFQDLFLPDTGFAVGNPDLKPETSVNYNIGTIFKLYNWLNTGINFFKKYSINLITWNPGPGGKWRPGNISKVTTTGVEFENNALFFFNFLDSYIELTYNYSLMYVTDKSGQSSTDGKQLPLRPFETANFILSISRYKLFSFQIESHFVGFRYLTAHNTKYLDSYLIHNLNAVYYYNSFRFSLLIKNFTQKKYIDIRGFPIPGIELYFTVGIKI